MLASVKRHSADVTGTVQEQVLQSLTKASSQCADANYATQKHFISKAQCVRQSFRFGTLRVAVLYSYLFAQQTFYTNMRSTWELGDSFPGRDKHQVRGICRGHGARSFCCGAGSAALQCHFAGGLVQNGGQRLQTTLEKNDTARKVGVAKASAGLVWLPLGWCCTEDWTVRDWTYSFAIGLMWQPQFSTSPCLCLHQQCWLIFVLLIKLNEGIKLSSHWRWYCIPSGATARAQEAIGAIGGCSTMRGRHPCKVDQDAEGTGCRFDVADP